MEGTSLVTKPGGFAAKGAIIMSKTARNVKKDLLVGKFFHTFKDDLLDKQGEVLGMTPDGSYLVAYFSWLCGDELYQVLVRPEEMHDWWFYPDSETMRYSVAHGPASRRKD